MHEDKQTGDPLVKTLLRAAAAGQKLHEVPLTQIELAKFPLPATWAAKLSPNMTSHYVKVLYRIFDLTKKNLNFMSTY